MNHYETAIECLTQAEKAHETLPIMLVEKDYCDVVCQSANIVDLSLQSMLQFAGVEMEHRIPDPELIPLVEDSIDRLPQIDRKQLRRMRDIHRRLAVKREKAVATVGVPANIPPEERPGPKQFSRDEAVRAIEWSDFVIKAAQRVIKDFDD